jgi:ADP-heptose:LPS heptosyltransferase
MYLFIILSLIFAGGNTNSIHCSSINFTMFLNRILTGNIKDKPWAKSTLPKRVLVIRLQAMGDAIITLPYVQHLRNVLPPNVKIDLLTRSEVDAIPRNIYLYKKIYSIRGRRNFKKQFFYTCALLPTLLLRRYNVVIDLQDNLLSRLVLKVIMPGAWSVFDRHSPTPAGERTRNTIENAGLGPNMANTHFTLKTTGSVEKLLRDNGWDDNCDLIILNPAGAFETRNWPLPNYTAFARLWMGLNPKTQFVIMGIDDAMAARAAYLKSELGNLLINLTNKTSPVQAFAIVQKVKMVLSEDSGLMHMAWVSGIPTLAIFGSTRSDWARPLGSHTAFLDSSDLPCGNCMLQVCRYANNHCLTRYTPGFIFAKAVELLHSAGK